MKTQTITDTQHSEPPRGRNRFILVLSALTLTLLSCRVHRGGWPSLNGVEVAQRMRVMRKSGSCSVASLFCL